MALKDLAAAMDEADDQPAAPEVLESQSLRELRRRVYGNHAEKKIVKSEPRKRDPETPVTEDESNKKRQKKVSDENRARATSSNINASENQPAQTVIPREAIPEKTLSLLACITNDDIVRVAQVWRESLDATQKIWVRTGGADKGHWDFIPDTKSRLAAAAALAAYREGLPVARQIQLRGEIEGADEMLEKLKASPEAMKALAALHGSGVEIAIGDRVIDVEVELNGLPDTVEKHREATE